MKIKESYHKIRLDEQSQDRILETLLSSQETVKTKMNYKPLISFALTFFFILIPLYFGSMGKSSAPMENPESRSELYSIPSEFTLEELINQDFYILTSDQTYNQDIMNTFLHNIDNKISSSIIIVHLTIEGDPILQDIHYTPEKTTIYRDASRDQFGKSSEIEILEFNHLGVLENNLYAYNENLHLDTVVDENIYHITYIAQK